MTGKRGVSSILSGRRSQNPAQRAHLPPIGLSQWSTSSVPDSAWSSADFLMGAGMVVIQENTENVLVIFETQKKFWFFPRGRKDMGESLEQTALREGYEESGYRIKFLPLNHPTRQPPPHGVSREEASRLLHTEPIYITVRGFGAKSNPPRHGTEYMTTWYAGSIPEDAEPEANTGMPDEVHFESYLMPYHDALERVSGQERMLLQYVWACWLRTKAVRAKVLEEQALAAAGSQVQEESKPLVEEGST